MFLRFHCNQLGISQNFSNKHEHPKHMSNQSQFSQKYVDVLKMCKNIELNKVAYINNDDDIDDDDD